MAKRSKGRQQQATVTAAADDRDDETPDPAMTVFDEAEAGRVEDEVSPEEGPTVDDEVALGELGDFVVSEPAPHSPAATARRHPDAVAVPMPATLTCLIHGAVVPVRAGQTNQMVRGDRLLTWYRFRCPRCQAPRFARVEMALPEQSNDQR